MVDVVRTKEDFEKRLKDAGDKPVVVDFSAAWCGPCKMIGPKFEEMAKSNSKFIGLKIDVDECEDVAMEYEISAMPTFIVIQNGKKVQTLVGASEAKLKEMIEKYTS